MIEIAGLTILVLLAWGAVAVSLLFLKAVLWLVLLPVRLLFYVLLLPLLFVLKAVVGGVLLLVVGPVIVIAMLAALLTAAVAIAVPLLPLAFIGLVIWFFARLSRPAPAPTRA